MHLRNIAGMQSDTKLEIVGVLPETASKLVSDTLCMSYNIVSELGACDSVHRIWIR